MKLSSVQKMVTLFAFICLTGCTGQAGIIPSPEMTATQPAVTTSTITPTETHTPEPTPTLTATPAIIDRACSPLSGIDLNELYAITSNTFDFKSAFSDLGHPGIDLAFFKYKNFSTMLGLPVQALLPGYVVEVVDDRFPYGNMILIETPLSMVSEEFIQSIALPTPIPQENIEAFSTCDKDMTSISWSADKKSIYSLYAHLESKPDFQTGDWVSCGEQIGAIGITGNSVAEHLHLEVRIGPANAKFNTIAMYMADDTPEERYNYCIWSISGNFQAVDPAAFWRDIH